MAGRLEGRGFQRAAVCLFAASLALTACQKKNAPGAEPREKADWRSRVADAHKYGERRKKEWAVVPVQSAIGVEILAGEPTGGARKATAGTTAPARPAVTVAPTNLAPQDVARMRERARNAVGIVVYTTSWCGVCGVARDHMRQRGIAFVERNVGTRDDWKRRMVALNPKGSVPTFDIDGLVMVGFGEEHLGQLIERATEARFTRLLQGPKTIVVSQP